LEKEETVLGTSRVGPKFRITLIKNVQERLDIDQGDLVVYVEDQQGNVILRRSKIRAQEG
jgi:bifunctional DNA-binding transcriptional regulator/antitoxin component of YhaV-PrlF toxin-antitoxin module